MAGISKWMVLLAILSYVFYVINFICPQESSSIFVHNLTCESYDYIRPSVKPFIDTVTVKLEEVLTKLHLDPFISQLREKSGEVATHMEPLLSHIQQSTTQVGDKLRVAITPLINWIQSVAFELQIRIVPSLRIWFNGVKVHTQVGIIKIWDLIKFKVQIIWVELSYRVNTVFTNQIKPYVGICLFNIQNSSTFLIVKHYYHEYKLDMIVDWVSCCYKKLTDANNFQEKRDFLRNEFKNLIHFKTENIPQGNEAEVSEVVKDILEEITSSQVPSAKSVLDEVTSSVMTVATSSTEQVDLSLEDSDSDSDEPITILITSTRIVTLDTPTEEAGIVDNSIERKIEDEINYWDNKVNRTLHSALKNLSKDMSVIVNKNIDSIKPDLSDKFTKIQQANYEYYKQLNSMIKAIDKDSAQIQEENKIIENSEDSNREFVSRQDMRDKISESSTYCDSELDSIKESIQRSHQHILKEYFKEIQETIDVLESFAELTIQEFSNRLHSLITILENEPGFEEESTWKAWKRFHKIKQDIFNTRDLIFDQANAYQDNSFSEFVPVGLEEWGVYLKNIYFHADFLTSDNAEYLKLVRAKANVAFQLREKLVNQLNNPVDTESSNSTESPQNEVKEDDSESQQEDIPVESEDDSESLQHEDNPVENEESNESPLDYDSGAETEDNANDESEDLD